MKEICLAFALAHVPSASALADDNAPTPREALKWPVINQFKEHGSMVEPKTPAEVEKRLDELLEGSLITPLQIDDDKPVELAIWFLYGSGNHHNGVIAFVDLDTEGTWRVLGFGAGSGPRVTKEKHDGYFDIEATHHLGGDTLMIHTYRFKKGAYVRVASERTRLVGD